MHTQRVLRAHFIQVCVVSMHQNGRDTHIRQVKVYGPRQPDAHHMLPATGISGGFSTLEFSQFDQVR